MFSVPSYDDRRLEGLEVGVHGGDVIVHGRLVAYTVCSKWPRFAGGLIWPQQRIGVLPWPLSSYADCEVGFQEAVDGFFRACVACF